MKKYLITLFSLCFVLFSCSNFIPDGTLSLEIDEATARSVYNTARSVSENQAIKVEVALSGAKTATESKTITKKDDFSNLKFNFSSIPTSSSVDVTVTVKVGDSLTLYSGTTKGVYATTEGAAVQVDLKKQFNLEKASLNLTVGDSDRAVVTFTNKINNFFRCNSGDKLNVQVTNDYPSCVETTITVIKKDSSGAKTTETQTVTGKGKASFSVEPDCKYFVSASGKIKDFFTSATDSELMYGSKAFVSYPTTDYMLYSYAKATIGTTEKYDLYLTNISNLSDEARDSFNLIDDDLSDCKIFTDFTYVEDDENKFKCILVNDSSTGWQLYYWTDSITEGSSKSLSKLFPTTETHNLFISYDRETETIYLADDKVSDEEDILTIYQTTSLELTITDSSNYPKLFGTLSPLADYTGYTINSFTVSGGIAYFAYQDNAANGSDSHIVAYFLVDTSSNKDSAGRLLKMKTLNLSNLTEFSGNYPYLSTTKFSDLIVMDDLLYVLINNCSFSIDKAPDGTTSSTPAWAGTSRGALLKLDGFTLERKAMLGWTTQAAATVYETGEDEEGTPTLTKHGDLYYPKTASSGFYGPERFVAVAPGKVIFSDDGYYTSWAKTEGESCSFTDNVIRNVVTVDLNTFAVSGTIDVKSKGVYFNNGNNESLSSGDKGVNYYYNPKDWTKNDTFIGDMASRFEIK